MVSHFRFQNGVIGQLVTGYGTKGFVNRLIGSDGMIEVGYSPEIRACAAWATARGAT